MKKIKRSQIVASILGMICTTRVPKKQYGYFSRKQLLELHEYLLMKKSAERELIAICARIKTVLCQNSSMDREISTLLRRAEQIIRGKAVIL